MYKAKADRLAKAVIGTVPDPSSLLDHRRAHEEASWIVMGMSFAPKGAAAMQRKLKGLFGHAFMGARHRILSPRKRRISFMFATRHGYRVVQDKSKRLEPNITIYRAIMDNHKGRWHNRLAIAATISVHALSRRLERGGVTADQTENPVALLDIVRVIAEQAQTARLLGTMAPGKTAPIAMPEGLAMCRLDSLVHAEPEPIAQMRTFLARDTLDPFQRRLHDGLMPLYAGPASWDAEDLARNPAFEGARAALAAYAARPREASFRTGVPDNVLERLAQEAALVRTDILEGHVADHDLEDDDAPDTRDIAAFDALMEPDPSWAPLAEPRTGLSLDRASGGSKEADAADRTGNGTGDGIESAEPAADSEQGRSEQDNPAPTVNPLGQMALAELGLPAADLSGDRA